MEVSVSLIGQAVVDTTIDVDPSDYLDYETEDDVISALQDELRSISDGALYQNNDCGDIRMDDVEDILWDNHKFDAFIEEWKMLKEND